MTYVDIVESSSDSVQELSDDEEKAAFETMDTVHYFSKNLRRQPDHFETVPRKKHFNWRTTILIAAQKNPHGLPFLHGTESIRLKYQNESVIYLRKSVDGKKTRVDCTPTIIRRLDDNDVTNSQYTSDPSVPPLPLNLPPLVVRMSSFYSAVKRKSVLHREHRMTENFYETLTRRSTYNRPSRTPLRTPRKSRKTIRNIPTPSRVTTIKADSSSESSNSENKERNMSRTEVLSTLTPPRLIAKDDDSSSSSASISDSSSSSSAVLSDVSAKPISKQKRHVPTQQKHVPPNKDHAPIPKKFPSFPHGSLLQKVTLSTGGTTNLLIPPTSSSASSPVQKDKTEIRTIRSEKPSPKPVNVNKYDVARLDNLLSHLKKNEPKDSLVHGVLSEISAEDFLTSPFSPFSSKFHESALLIDKLFYLISQSKGTPRTYDGNITLVELFDDIKPKPDPTIKSTMFGQVLPNFAGALNHHKFTSMLAHSLSLPVPKKHLIPKLSEAQSHNSIHAPISQVMDWTFQPQKTVILVNDPPPKPAYSVGLKSHLLKQATSSSMRPTPTPSPKSIPLHSSPVFPASPQSSPLPPPVDQTASVQLPVDPSVALIMSQQRISPPVTQKRATDPRLNIPPPAPSPQNTPTNPVILPPPVIVPNQSMMALPLPPALPPPAPATRSFLASDLPPPPPPLHPSTS
ncbi:hypothetical protein BLNAU_2203 [Blattamonas nauphoetae]|uniref:Uncharacterized protein n=1 Tax=Blattamonas nauphoetae TaxID=2049346 RepID=A0ABQ9YG71_9EUKA|nr:hypothetical protein BLNAU_2203 [Blattamonas nauphoetae]